MFFIRIGNCTINLSNLHYVRKGTDSSCLVFNDQTRIFLLGEQRDIFHNALDRLVNLQFDCDDVPMNMKELSDNCKVE